MALKDGIVIGGGLCLDRIAKAISNPIMAKALSAPYNQLVFNGGALIEEDPNVVDAALVVKNAARNGIALASTILNIGMTITLPPKPIETLKDKQMTW